MKVRHVHQNKEYYLTLTVARGTMATKNSYDQKLQQKRIAREIRLTDGILALSNNVVMWAGIVLALRYIYMCVEAISGKLTDFNVGVVASLEVSVILAWTVGLSGVVYGRLQRRLRKDVIEKLQGRINQLEKQIDKNRSSSKLTPRGDTRPEDKL